MVTKGVHRFAFAFIFIKLSILFRCLTKKILCLFDFSGQDGQTILLTAWQTTP